MDETGVCVCTRPASTYIHTTIRSGLTAVAAARVLSQKVIAHIQPQCSPGSSSHRAPSETRSDIQRCALRAMACPTRPRRQPAPAGRCDSYQAHRSLAQAPALVLHPLPPTAQVWHACDGPCAVRTPVPARGPSAVAAGLSSAARTRRAPALLDARLRSSSRPPRPIKIPRRPMGARRARYSMGVFHPRAADGYVSPMQPTSRPVGQRGSGLVHRNPSCDGHGRAHASRPTCSVIRCSSVGTTSSSLVSGVDPQTTAAVESPPAPHASLDVAHPTMSAIICARPARRRSHADGDADSGLEIGQAVLLATAHARPHYPS